VVLSEEHERRFRNFYARAFSGEAFTDTDIVEGEVTYAAEISFCPIRRGDEIIGTACHSRDITRRIKEEEERKIMLADLLRYSKNLEQFAYVVSHNLRSPVANILGLSNLLKSGLSEDENKLCQEHMYKAVDQLDITVKDLNKILEARAAVGQNREKVDLENVVDGVKIAIRNILESERVTIETDFEVPEVHAIKSYVYSFFYNLITNSIKYRQSGRDPMIRISSRKQNGNTLIVFRDNGLGMNMEQYGNKVFGLYQRFHHHVSGKGMGLFMVRTQVEALEGRISLQSSPGEGAEFTIELPVLPKQ
jgi:signal transduction histidine kinase